MDLATTNAPVTRILGSASTGRFGTPVAGGFDVDGDGFLDFGLSAMVASPLGRAQAGQVYLIFGDGTIGTTLDTALADPTILVIAGAGEKEAAGGEIWMDDVTGDGVGDLLIGRFNYSAGGRIGAGAVTLIVGSPELRNIATNSTILDLATPPANITVVALEGAEALDRVGFWVRTGDVDGDGISDIAFSADQRDTNGSDNAGAVYLLRGGPHLSSSTIVDLADFGTTAFAGHLAIIEPPAGSSNFHFGATLALIDLDANGRAEVLSAASLSRVGGLLEAIGAPAGSGVRVGGNPGGSLFIFWDDNLPTGLWPAGLAIGFDNPPGSVSRMDGATLAGGETSDRFGEELIGGADYDGDGAPDLFVGDIRGDLPGKTDAGLGHVFFNAAELKQQMFSIDALPANVAMTTLVGGGAGNISSDTTLHGDIDGDGFVDLVVASPLADPNGRIDAGILHVIWGQPQPWPATIDLGLPSTGGFVITDILGARGDQSADDAGDTLMYSGLSADINGDGFDDFIINEMRGNGSSVLDVGNLLVIDGASVPR
ncbi:MAG: hypothetical protein O7E57_05160 [Gammaproteobacteria bacterium]|nr:hypothetical protein [Gammaproteobacteria bacterium]